MAQIDTKLSPYFDDYNESKKFHKILFRPGRALQARELNQIQSMLQKQIDRMGSHIFEQGAQVLPASKDGVKYVSNNAFIKLTVVDNSKLSSKAQLETYWLGKTITNSVGVQATVIGFREPDNIGGGEARLYLNYISAGGAENTQQTFKQGEQVQTVESSPLYATIPNRANAIGTIASVIIEQSIYFYNGNFIFVDPQTHFIIPNENADLGDNLPDTENPWLKQPTAVVGLSITESLVDHQDDESLLDNALSTPNYSAPGADRLKISADLIQIGLNDVQESFIPLIKVINGSVQLRVVNTDYSKLEDTLARRTFDESGDYTVIPFKVQIKEFLRNETNNGAHSIEEFYFENSAFGKLQAERVATTIFNIPVTATTKAFLHEVSATKSYWMPGTSYDDVNDTTSFISMCSDRLTAKIDPGKAYVKGYEIEKVATSTVDFKKSRTTVFRNGQTISTPLGTFLYVKNMVGTPKFYGSVDLHKNLSGNSKIGTAKILSLDFFTGLIGTSSAVYRLFLFDVKVNAGEKVEWVRSLTQSNPTFKCETTLNAFKLSGTILVSANDLTLTGSGTAWRNNELERLVKDDYVSVSSGASEAWFRVEANPSTDNELSVIRVWSASSPAVAIPSGSSIRYLYSSTQSNSSQTGLLFNLPENFVYALRTADANGALLEQTDALYTVRRQWGVADSVTVTAGKATIAVSGTESFESFSSNGYAVINKDTGSWLDVLSWSDSQGTPPAGKAGINVANQQVTIYLPTGVSNISAIAPVIKRAVDLGSTTNLENSSSVERTKTLIKGTFDASGQYTTGGVVITSGSDVNEISLGKADVLRVTRIIQSNSYDVAPSTKNTLNPGDKDITALYELDNGQRDYYYDIAKVKLRPGFPKPTGKVRVEFDYFEHSAGIGGYFSADSYKFRGPTKQMNYEDVPTYVASDGTSYSLTDCIDFRPIVSESGIDSNTPFSVSFDPPKENFVCDYHRYEARIDKLYLDKDKNFYMKSGKPDVVAQPPDDPETGMVIYDLSLLPYTTDASSVVARLRDNKRYTMRDIGKLESRIKNLEYYTSLSLLETETNNLLIKDANGNDRFKNGFLVDNFTTFGVCDLDSNDFKASVDRIEKTARPLIKQDNIGLYQSGGQDFRKTGTVYTLPYNHVEMTSQKKASKVISVNPYDVTTYVGRVFLYPWSDTWRDVVNLEPLHVKDQSQWDVTRKSFGPSGTTIDYQITATNFTGINFNTQSKTELLLAGHEYWYDGKSKAEREKIIKRGWITVPEGLANAGARVPINVNGGRNSLTREIATSANVAVTGSKTTTSATSTFNDAGWSDPINMGSRVVETAVAEFMRSRIVYFKAKGFKPNSQVYPFFDNVGVSSYCVSISENFYEYASERANQLADIDVLSPSSFEDYMVDTTTDNEVGAFIAKIRQYRPILNNTTATNMGDTLITDARGAVYGAFIIPNTEGFRFRTGGRIFRLTTSEFNQKTPIPESAGENTYTATGYIENKQETTYSTRLYTIERGSTTDNEDIELTDSAQLASCPMVVDPIAQSFFVREDAGCFITKLDVYFYKKPTKDVRPPLTVQIRTMSEDSQPTAKALPFGTVILDADDVITNTYDHAQKKLIITRPISGRISRGTIQNQLIGSNTNFSSEVKIGDVITIGAQALIVTQINSNSVLTLSANVNAAISNAKLSLVRETTQITSDNFIPTTITFESPVYLAAKTSYCFVLISDSSEYRVWIAQRGNDVTFKDPENTWLLDNDNNVEIGTDKPIDGVVFVDGTFFKSENALTWVADPTVDMMFTLYKANFDVNKIGELEFVNNQLPLKKLTVDPFQTKAGYSRIRVMHQGHSQAAQTGSKVAFLPDFYTMISQVVVNSTTVTSVNTLPDFIQVNAFVRNDATGEVRRIESVNAINKTFTLSSAFTVSAVAITRLSVSQPVPTSSELNGINPLVLFRRSGFTVQRTELDSYIVDLSETDSDTSTPGIQASSVTASGNVGGLYVYATDNLRFEEMTLLTTPLVLPKTDISWNVQTVSGKGVTDLENIARQVMSRKNLAPNEKLIFDKPMQISSSINEISGNKSLNIRAVLKSDDVNISPVIDTSRLSVFTISNRIDDPSNSLINDVFDDYVCIPNTVEAPTLGSSLASGLLSFTSSSGELSGTISAEANSKIITGNNDTKFLSEVAVGDVVKENNQQIERVVTEVRSDTELVVDIAYPVEIPANTKLYTNSTYMKIRTNNATVAQQLSKLDVGKYLTVTGASSDVTGTRNFTDKKILHVSYTPTDDTIKAEVEVEYRTLYAAGPESNSGVTIVQKDRFIDEIAPSGGSVGSKYVCKKMVVTKPSNALKVMFDGNRHKSCNFELYYKLEPINSPTPIDQLNWVKAEFNVETNGVYENKTPDANESTMQFSAYECTLSNLPSFVGAQVKIVMRGGNPAKSPKIKNFRLIILDE